MRTVLHDVELDDCFLCAANGGTPHLLPWYDKPLVHQEAVGIALSAVGALTPGHLLVAPAQHTHSVRDLPAAERHVFLEFTRQVQRRVEGVYGAVTLFEHGSCRDPGQRRSACIAHSHIHLIPGRYSFNVLPLAVTPFNSLADLLSSVAVAGRGDGYLMYQEPGDLVHLVVDVGVSQFFRRHIAAVLGEPDGWDYALFPRWDNVRRTHLDLRRLALEVGPRGPTRTGSDRT